MHVIVTYFEVVLTYIDVRMTYFEARVTYLEVRVTYFASLHLTLAIIYTINEAIYLRDVR